jgi:chromosome segregation ATPase
MILPSEMDFNQQDLTIEIDQLLREHILERNTSDYKNYDELRMKIDSLRIVIDDVKYSIKEMEDRVDLHNYQLNNEIKKQFVVIDELNEEIKALKGQIKEMGDQNEKEFKTLNDQLKTQSELNSKLMETITHLETRISNDIQNAVMNGFISILRMPAAVLQNEPNGRIKEKTD